MRLWISVSWFESKRGSLRGSPKRGIPFLFTKRKAFTLLELLVVVITIGVLASVALPNLWRQIERSTKAAEALSTLGVIIRSMDAYGPTIVSNPDYSASDIFNMIGMDDPGAKPDSKFNYSFWYSPGSSPPQYGAVAVDKDDVSNQIALNRNIASYGVGIFQGIKLPGS
jgi:prepilin-type N-terminal cleavage/methylation domain-containing protein